jgi:glycerol-3-phosphate dehydrogenase (NAD(P)+)
MKSITILGAGSWGSALAIQLARNGCHVKLWGRGDSVRTMQASRCNERYLPNTFLPEGIDIYLDFEQAVSGVQDILIAVPSDGFSKLVRALHALRPEKIRLAWATKGLSPENQLLHEVVFQVYNENLPIAIIAGPSFAREVASGLPTAITLTCNDTPFEQDLVTCLHGQRFRVYLQHDFIGVQICGAVKNCLAIATGISDGLGYGANARAALITRGLAEMTRLGLAMGGQQETFMGLAGLGDLVLTCTDNQSRNRRFGYAVGQGVNIEQAEKDIGQVVEGKYNAVKVMALAKHYQVEMPITEQVSKVLEGEVAPYESVEKLFARQPKKENIK